MRWMICLALAVSAAQAQTSAGMPAQEDAPAFVADLPLNAWTALPTVNNMEDVFPADLGQYGRTGPAAILVAWNSAVYLSGVGEYGSIIHWGGGHHDYYGNEIYRFDIGTLTWTRVNDPHIETGGFAGPFTGGLLSNDTPNVPHTYFLVDAWGPYKYLTVKRQVQANPSYGTNRPSYFDFENESYTWTNYDDSSSPVNLRDEGGITYDSSRDLFWAPYASGNDLLSFDPNTGEWSRNAEPTETSIPKTNPLYLPNQDLIVIAVTKGLWTYDPANPRADKVGVTTSGTGPAFTNGSAMHWSPNLGLIIYHPSRSDDIYTLDPTTWTWDQLSLSGTPGAYSPGRAGTYRRFQVIEWGNHTVALILPRPGAAYYAVRLR